MKSKIKKIVEQFPDEPITHEFENELDSIYEDTLRDEDTKFVSHEELERREKQEKDDKSAKRIYYSILIALASGFLILWITIFWLIFGR